jgi:aerobic-type carbon monoxide dehydrogenase small subunit (CoxS/CutS family)
VSQRTVDCSVVVCCACAFPDHVQDKHEPSALSMHDLIDFGRDRDFSFFGIRHTSGRSCSDFSFGGSARAERHFASGRKRIYHFKDGSRAALTGVPMGTIRLSVNGNARTVGADSQTSLLSVLREQLDLTGTKYGCGEGQCGACTVLVDGKAQRSCITRVTRVAQKQITTIEGLASGARLHPVQQAFLEEGALQCGYCTPGMIMSAVALLEQNHHPSQSEIVEFMDGNICRCGAYCRIIRAIEKAAKRLAVSVDGKEPRS